jgi:hypothetical protein
MMDSSQTTIASLRSEIHGWIVAHRSAVDAMNAVGQRALDDRAALCAVLAPDLDPREPGAAGLLLERARQVRAEVEALRAELDAQRLQPLLTRASGGGGQRG